MFDDLSDQALESELCSQASQLAAGECHLLLMMGELERREIWARQGARNCADWLSWRIGTALGAAREQLRVARALGRLDKVRAAFSSGELSYSKVRAITRVADEQSEEHLVYLARHATAAQLEQICRAYRRADPNERQRANAHHRARYLRHRLDDDGMVLIEARLDPEEAALVLAAIEQARQALAERAAPADVSAETRHAGHDPAEQEPDADDVSAETRSEPGAPADGEDDRIDTPEVSRADALVALCSAVLSQGLEEGEEQPVRVLVHVDEQVLADPGAPGCAHIEGIGAISAHAAARLCCEGALTRLLYRKDGSVEQIGATRVIPKAMRRALLVRDGGCRFPGCSARRFLHAHHVVHVAKGGQTKLSNLVTLCSTHHRLIHDGGWRLELAENGSLRVRDTTGRLLSLVPVPARASREDLASANARRGLRLCPEALRGDGERFDLGLTIDALLSVREVS
jgi:hypothetical protein